MSNMEQEKEKAVQKYVHDHSYEHCPELFEQKQFEDGFDAGVKAERERIMSLIDYCALAI